MPHICTALSVNEVRFSWQQAGRVKVLEISGDGEVSPRGYNGVKPPNRHRPRPRIIGQTECKRENDECWTRCLLDMTRPLMNSQQLGLPAQDQVGLRHSARGAISCWHGKGALFLVDMSTGGLPYVLCGHH